MLSRNRKIIRAFGACALGACTAAAATLPAAPGAAAALPGTGQGRAPAMARGAVAHARVVSADPVDYTPHVLDGIVNAFALVGRKVVVGGSFTRVQNAGESREMRRTNLFAFDLYTGKVDENFAPVLDGTVYALAPGAGDTVYVGGAFDTVNHWPAHALTRLSLEDGRAVHGFTPWVRGGEVNALVAHGGHLYVGGDFRRIGEAERPALARLDARTGAPDLHRHAGRSAAARPAPGVRDGALPRPARGRRRVHHARRAVPAAARPHRHRAEPGEGRPLAYRSVRAGLLVGVSLVRARPGFFA